MKFLPVICQCKATLLFVGFKAWHKRSPSKAIDFLLKAQRNLIRSHCYDVKPTNLLIHIEKAIARDILRKEEIQFEWFLNMSLSEKDLWFIKKRGLVLKATSTIDGRVMEKGVFLLKLGRRLPDFYRIVDMAALLKHYTLILEDVWSGHANRNILYLTRFTSHPIIIMAPETGDFIFLERLKTNLLPVSIGSCDWVNPSIFRPLNKQPKRYDAIMVAGWRQYKRHHILFRTLRDIRDPSFKVALVARSWTGNRKEIERLIDIYSVASNVTIFEDLTPEEVNEILNQSKVNILLSLQEGGNRSLSEGFFAGVPAIALKRNVGIPKDHFTSQTGRLIDEKNLGSMLLHFRKHWTNYDPRSWAEANINPVVTAKNLSEILRAISLQRGEQWTTDLVAKSNIPNLSYYPNENAGKELPSTMDLMMQYARSEEVREIVRRKQGYRQ